MEKLISPFLFFLLEVFMETFTQNVYGEIYFTFLFIFLEVFMEKFTQNIYGETYFF